MKNLTKAALLEKRKAMKYSHLAPTYLFTPVTTEAVGAIGPLTRVFLLDLGSCVQLQESGSHTPQHICSRDWQWLYSEQIHL